MPALKWTRRGTEELAQLEKKRVSNRQINHRGWLDTLVKFETELDPIAFSTSITEKNQYGKRVAEMLKILKN